MGVWAICSTILLNCYIGLAITNLNSPLSSNVPNDFVTISGSRKISAYERNQSSDGYLLKKRFNSFLESHLTHLNLQIPNFYKPLSNSFILLSLPVGGIVIPKYLHHYELQNIVMSSWPKLGNNPGWVTEVLYYMMDAKKRFYPIRYNNYPGKKLLNFYVR